MCMCFDDSKFVSAILQFSLDPGTSWATLVTSEATAVAAEALRGGGYKKQNTSTLLLVGAFACHWLGRIYLQNVWL